MKPLTLPRLAMSVWTLAVAFEARLATELEPLGISVAGFRLIGELLTTPDGLRTKELAKRLGVKPPSVTTMVSRLVDAGVVTLEEDPADARGTRVCLAKKAPLQDGVDVLRRVDQRLGKRLSAKQKQNIETTLATLIENLEVAS